MSDLQVFDATGEAAQLPKLTTNDPAVIAAELAERGIGFERWPARAELPAGAGPDAVLAASARLQNNSVSVDLDEITVSDSAGQETKLVSS